MRNIHRQHFAMKAVADSVYISIQQMDEAASRPHSTGHATEPLFRHLDAKPD